MTESHWLIWSIKHNAWWEKAENGYTPLMENAGRYTLEEAIRIVRSCNWNKDRPVVGIVPLPGEEEP